MPRIKPTRFVFQAVHLVRPCEVVAYRLTEAIRAGDVKVGDRLPSEQSLSEQLGVSRPTLREATKLLAQAGIVQVFPGSSGGAPVATARGKPAEPVAYYAAFGKAVGAGTKYMMVSTTESAAMPHTPSKPTTCSAGIS